MTRFALSLALIASLVAAPAADARKSKPKPKKAKAAYTVGAAKTSTNPPEGMRLCLGGYGACPDGGGRTMTGVRDDMHARALAVSSGSAEDALILVHTTNIGFFAAYKTPGLGIHALRRTISERTGVPSGNVIVQADHSHSSPDTIGIWGGVPPEYIALMQERAADAAVSAWRARRPARLSAGTADGPGITSSYESEPNLSTDDEFRLLWADDAKTGERIATWANYSPHATVLGSQNTGASGDWPEWAAEIAEERFGGIGIAGVGSLGREDFGADESRGLDAAQADAQTRLRRMVEEATAAGRPVPAAGGVRVRSVFIREPMAQPILTLNLVPEGTIDAGGYDLSLDRATTAPWLTGTAVGTYAGAARIGDVFIGMAPGESFPEVQEYLRDDGGVRGPRIYFHLGATNDFLGYMSRPADHYPQVLVEGAGYLLGCPEEEILSAFAIPYDDACTDHWTLMVSPTIGSHVACTIQDAAVAVGFTAGRRDEACDALTRTDGAAAPDET